MFSTRAHIPPDMLNLVLVIWIISSKRLNDAYTSGPHETWHLCAAAEVYAKESVDSKVFSEHSEHFTG